MFDGSVFFMVSRLKIVIGFGSASKEMHRGEFRMASSS